jgi:hypothetical protein
MSQGSSVSAKAPLTHLPAPPNVAVAVAVPAGQPARTVPAVAAGLRSLTIGNTTVKIDPTSYTPQNVIDVINGANIAGVTATLDRYGQLVISGVSQVGGDNSLLQHLGLA